MKNRKSKTSLELMREIRSVWAINPKTRIHDNNIRKNRKKMRQDSKKIVKRALSEEMKELFY